MGSSGATSSAFMDTAHNLPGRKDGRTRWEGRKDLRPERQEKLNVAQTDKKERRQKFGKAVKGAFIWVPRCPQRPLLSTEIRQKEGLPCGPSGKGHGYVMRRKGIEP